MILLKYKTSSTLVLGVFLVLFKCTNGQSSIGLTFGKVLQPNTNTDVFKNSFVNVSDNIIARHFFQVDYQRKLTMSKVQLVDFICIDARIRNERFDVLLNIKDYDEVTNSLEVVPFYNFSLGLSLNKKVFPERKLLAEIGIGVNYGLVFYPILDLRHSYDLYGFFFEREYFDYFGLYLNLNTQHFISKNLSIGPFISIPVLSRFSYETDVYVKTTDNEELYYEAKTSGSNLCVGLSLRRHFNRKEVSD
ncbi:MAG: hypothetical protein ACPGLV_04150 [Bacteroidia bacterium]